MLNLYDNRLSGTIPMELGALTHLEFLDLSGNDLSGTIPVALGNLSDLRELHLGRFGIRQAELPGPIPPELGNLTKLQALSLTNLGLTGSIPSQLGNLTSLSSLTLDFNELTGPIPARLGNLRDLVRLRVTGNDLTGTIPPQLGKLAKLQELLAGSNRLDGRIPAELGNLSHLQDLTLHRNDLTGSLPPELGNLRRLKLLFVDENDLSGPIPLEFVNMPLSRFDWDDSRLCAPLHPAFQAWLESIRDMKGGSACLEDALAALYEATAGPDWTNATGWLTDAPISNWYGVATDEAGRITGLDLRGNELAGTVPPELGALAGLRNLDLRDNRLTGELPGELGELAELRELYLSGNRFEGRLPAELGGLAGLEALHVSDNRFTGALPSSLSRLSKLVDFQWNDSGLCAPAVAWYQAWLGTITLHSGGMNCSPALRLSVVGAHVNQAAQDLAGSVPLIAGRNGMLRIFATADQANGQQPGARASFFLDGREVHSAELELRSSLGIPEDAMSVDPDQYFRAEIPGEVLMPGVELVVEVDPDSVVPRAAGSVVRFPAQDRLQLDVREMPRMDLIVVPILTAEEPDSSVLDWVSELGPEHPTIQYVTQVLPVGEHSVKMREPFIRAEYPDSHEDWSYLVDEMRLLRTMDGGTGYYFGVIGGSGGGTAGIASGFLALGRLRAEIDHIMAHELGHAMYLFWHAPCGLGFASYTADPDYPHRDGSIGVWGYDARSGDLVPPSTPDVMGYCIPAWISDYHFASALRQRLRRENRAPPPATPDAGSDRARRLLLWGGTTPDGELRLNPAFTLDLPARLPTRAGPYRLEGFGTGGAREFSLDFEMDELSHGGGNFLFAIPLKEHWTDSLERIVLSGPEGTVVLNGASDQAMALVVDREMATPTPTRGSWSATGCPVGCRTERGFRP